MIELREVTKEYSKGVAALNGINLKILFFIRFILIYIISLIKMD